MIQPKLDSPPESVITLDWNNHSHRNAAADLTLALFADSPAGILGKKFLREFYFRDLVRDGEIECLLYRCDGKYVGFGVYTTAPFTFIKSGIKRHFVKLSYLVTQSLLLKPTRLAAVLNVLKQDGWRTEHKPEEKVGELLTFGVLESHRGHIDSTSGKKISAHLFKQSLENLKARGSVSAQLVALKDNLRAQAFFKKCGGRIDGSAYCFSHSTVISFDLDHLTC